MKKKIDLATAKSIEPVDVVAAINSGIQIIDAAAPVIKTLFEKIAQFFEMIGKNNPNSPHNVRLRLATLEAKDILQKELNKTFEARLSAMESGNKTP